MSASSPARLALCDAADALRLYRRDGDAARDGQNLFKVVGDGTVKIPVNHRFPLKDAAEAHRALEGRKTTGSTVLIP